MNVLLATVDALSVHLKHQILAQAVQLVKLYYLYAYAQMEYFQKENAIISALTRTQELRTANLNAINWNMD